jgi:UDP-glucuronate 4-epimerase
MALFIFTRAILEGRPIEIFNNGQMERDFTYVDDIVEGVVRVLEVIPRANLSVDMQRPDPALSPAPHRVYNIGNHRPVKLMDCIEILERALGRKAVKTFLPMQPGDVQATFADIDDLHAAVGFAPKTSLEDGVERFVAWYRNYYRA